MRGAASLAERVGADVPHELGLVQEHLLCGELEELAEGVRAARWAERRREGGEDTDGQNKSNRISESAKVTENLA